MQNWHHRLWRAIPSTSRSLFSLCPFFSRANDFCALFLDDCNSQINSSAPQVFVNGEMWCAVRDEEDGMSSGTGTENGAVKRCSVARTIHRARGTKRAQSTQFSCCTPGIFLKASAMDIHPQTGNSQFKCQMNLVSQIRQRYSHGCGPVSFTKHELACWEKQPVLFTAVSFHEAVFNVKSSLSSTSGAVQIREALNGIQHM